MRNQARIKYELALQCTTMGSSLDQFFAATHFALFFRGDPAELRSISARALRRIGGSRNARKA
jgi:hypothetical protein